MRLFPVPAILAVAVVSNALANPVAFRFTDLDLRDPHTFTVLPLLGCTDITDVVPFGLFPSFNESLQEKITTDSDLDGLLDLNVLIVFLDGAPGSSTPAGELAFHLAACTAPVSGTTCQFDPAHPVHHAAYSTSTAGTCLEPIPGTTRPYSPAITTPAAPCFVSDPTDILLDLGGIPLELQDVQLAATTVGDPATLLVNGLLLGFLTEAAAESILLPPDTPILGGQPISTLLPGGAGNCAAGDDRDVGQDGTTPGWWVYMNFQAAEVPFDGATAAPLAPEDASALALGPGRPSPFRGRTRLSFALPRAGHTRLSVVDVRGRRVATLIDGTVGAGPHEAVWDGTNLSGHEAAPGVYFVRLEAAGGVRTRKVVLAQ